MSQGPPSHQSFCFIAIKCLIANGRIGHCVTYSIHAIIRKTNVSLILLGAPSSPFKDPTLRAAALGYLNGKIIKWEIQLSQIP